MHRDKLELTQEDGYRALQGHIVDKAELARQRYGPLVDAQALRRILLDRDIVRHPTELVFDGATLRKGEFAHAQMVEGSSPRSFQLLLHEYFRDREADWPLLAAYHIPSINYLDLVTNEEAELFGATLLGLEVEAYYARVCALADELDAAR
jgi:hypothetical protein